MTANEIRRIEELSLNAWPALRQVIMDGWVLRFAEGYTRRCNSVQPLYPGTEDLARKIAACEEQYVRQRLPLIFKMTAAAQPTGLDDVLERAGFRETDHTSVQTLEMNGRIDDLPSITGWDRPVPQWLDCIARYSGINESQATVLGRIVNSIVPEARFGAIIEQDEIRACGMAVLEGNWMGLFDILTSPQHRRCGYARRLINGLLGWGHSRGATHAYLQVRLDNAPALRLYERVGFRGAYQYWYRSRG